MYAHQLTCTRTHTQTHVYEYISAQTLTGIQYVAPQTHKKVNLIERNNVCNLRKLQYRRRRWQPKRNETEQMAFSSMAPTELWMSFESECEVDLENKLCVGSKKRVIQSTNERLISCGKLIKQFRSGAHSLLRFHSWNDSIRMLTLGTKCENELMKMWNAWVNGHWASIVALTEDCGFAFSAEKRGNKHAHTTGTTEW